MELNKWIYVKKKANGLNFYMCHVKVKECQHNKIRIQLKQEIAGNLHKIQVQFGLGFLPVHRLIFGV